jgi:hypothetical protein
VCSPGPGWCREALVARAGQRVRTLKARCRPRPGMSPNQRRARDAGRHHRRAGRGARRGPGRHHLLRARVSSRRDASPPPMPNRPLRCVRLRGRGGGAGAGDQRTSDANRRCRRRRCRLANGCPVHWRYSGDGGGSSRGRTRQGGHDTGTRAIPTTGVGLGDDGGRGVRGAAASGCGHAARPAAPRAAPIAAVGPGRGAISQGRSRRPDADPNRARP